MGWKVDSPESVQEKVEAIHDLATDDAVAAVVTTDFLRRPAVADKAMADDTARHAVNEAQFDRFRQQAQFVHQEAAPQLQRMEHSAQFMDLVAACAQFAATAAGSFPACAASTTTTPNATPSVGALPGYVPRPSGSRTPSPEASSTWTSS